MTNTPSDDELRHRMQAADPAASLPPADPDRVTGLVERAVTHDVRATGPRGRNRLTWLVAAAAVVLLAAITGYAVFGRDDAPPTAGEEPSGAVEQDPGVATIELAGPVGAGRCMVPSPELLAGQDLAFEATVTGIADGVVTLDPERFFAGTAVDAVTVTAPPEAAMLDTGVVFEAGGTYLVAATGGQVNGCGLSGEATPQLRALYDEAFGL